MTVTMLTKLARRKQEQERPSSEIPEGESSLLELEAFAPPPPDMLVLQDYNGNNGRGTGAADSRSGGDYRFSVGKLPVWAKNKIAEGSASGKPQLPGQNNNNNYNNLINNANGSSNFPKGRWGQKVVGEGQELTVRSHHDGDSVVPFPVPPSNPDATAKEGSSSLVTPEGHQFEHKQVRIHQSDHALTSIIWYDRVCLT